MVTDPPSEGPAVPAPATAPRANPSPTPAFTANPAPARRRQSQRPARAPAGELTSALSAIALLLTTFVMKWYGVVALPHSADRSGIQSAVSAWTELSLVRWLIVAAALVTLGSVALHVSQRTHGAQTNTSVIVTGIGTLAAVVVGYRVLVELPSPQSVIDAKLGAYLGLLAATGIALGGYESVLAHRRGDTGARRRRPATAPTEPSVEKPTEPAAT